MRYGIFAATPRGCQQAIKTAHVLQGQIGELGKAEVWIHDKQVTVMKALPEQDSVSWQGYHRLADIFAQGWGNYDALIFIMATGIVVRTLAPHLVNKLSDPAVLVMDDRGQNIISLLSGHLGGANRLTAYLASQLGANPVITTATDVNNLLAPDVVAADLQCVPMPKANLPLFNGSLLSGKKLVYWLDSGLKAREAYEAVLKKHQLNYELVDDLPAKMAGIASAELYVVCTAASATLPVRENVLYLQPRRLIAGVGCRRDTEQELIEKALQEACQSIGWSVGRLSQLASTVVKSDEAGLLAVAEKLHIPIKFFPNQPMAEIIQQYQLEESSFVKQTIGIGNICEAAALCSVPHGRIALAKHKYEKVTVALVWQK